MRDDNWTWPGPPPRLGISRRKSSPGRRITMRDDNWTWPGPGRHPSRHASGNGARHARRQLDL